MAPLPWNADPVDDQNIHQRIEDLVAEEHRLLERGGEMTPDERRRLGEVEVSLDRMWDLMRQRRAREEFGQDPGTARERSADIVEKYLQ